MNTRDKTRTIDAKRATIERRVKRHEKYGTPCKRVGGHR